MSQKMAMSSTSPRPASPSRATDAREREVARLRRLIEHAHAPRLQMMLIVALTGAGGFLASAFLLSFGVEALWLRYALAVVLAYLVFLFLLWSWLRLRHDDLVDGIDLIDATLRAGAPAPCEFGGGAFGGGGAGGSFDDAPAPASHAVAHASAGDAAPPKAGGGLSEAAAGALDLDELAAVVVAIAALAGALLAVFSLVWAAPVLLAELVFNAALAAGLYRRLRGVRGEHWLRTALRRTAGPFAVVALLFAVAGGALQHVVPEARSIGQVVDALRDPR
jgi:hypothetical protein